MKKIAKHVPKMFFFEKNVSLSRHFGISMEFILYFCRQNHIKRVAMRRHILTMGLMLAFVAAGAQNASDYIVKTKGVKKPELPEAVAGETNEAVKQTAEPTDFVGRNFKFYSLCDWKEGMKFMVLPEKYDLIVKTFSDAVTEKEVSSVSLRYHIMIYKGHSVSADGHSRINFQCQEDGKNYFYEIPYGSFEDYCYGKMGVPTLAYLGDVDIAREKLIGKKLVTRTPIFYEDTDAEGEGFREVKVPMNAEVTVTSVGVGTRKFPVKIIVEDSKGNEFYQNVALSKTNCGLRDDEFTLSYPSNQFYGSFSVMDDILAVPEDLTEYLGKTIHSKYVTPMLTKGDGRERTVRVPKMTTFTIDNITKLRNSEYVTLSLTEMESRRQFFVNVTTNYANAINDIKKEEYFGYLFALGEGTGKETSQAARAAIRAGRVIAGMTEDEVTLAVGEPDRVVADKEGYSQWIYNRSKGKLLVVHFGRNGLVQEYKTQQGTSAKSKTTAKKKRTTKK